VYKPVMIYNFLHSVTLIADACHGYVEYMIKGIEVDRAKVDWYVKELADAGDGAGAKGRIRQGRADRPYGARGTHQPRREAALKLGYLTGEEFDQLVRSREDDGGRSGFRPESKVWAWLRTAWMARSWAVPGCPLPPPPSPLPASIFGIIALAQKFLQNPACQRT